MHDTEFKLLLCAVVGECTRISYLTGDVRGHWRGRLGIDVSILGHEARIVGGNTAEAVGCNAPWWWRLLRHAAAVAIGGGGGR